MQHALDSRAVIEEAKGVLAERLCIDLAAAFDILRRHARAMGRLLHDVAGEVVAEELRLRE